MKRKILSAVFAFFLMGMSVPVFFAAAAETITVEGAEFTKNADGTLTSGGRNFSYNNDILKYIAGEKSYEVAGLPGGSLLYIDENKSTHVISDGKDYLKVSENIFESDGKKYNMSSETAGKFVEAVPPTSTIDPVTGRPYYDINGNGGAVAPATGGLIPCGRDGQERCTLCHFVVGFKGLIDFGMSIVVYLAIAAIFASGIMYILAFTDEGMVKNAKEMLTGTLKGFTFIMLGWLIVNVTLWVLAANVDVGQTKANRKWFEITCDKTTSFNPTTQLGKCSIKYKPDNLTIFKI